MKRTQTRPSITSTRADRLFVATLRHGENTQPRARILMHPCSDSCSACPLHKTQPGQAWTSRAPSSMRTFTTTTPFWDPTAHLGEDEHCEPQHSLACQKGYLWTPRSTASFGQEKAINSFETLRLSIRTRKLAWSKATFIVITTL